ncbi:MAG: hypothetical protein RIB60_00960 [Phycisphaerales bacterium]
MPHFSNARTALLALAAAAPTALAQGLSDLGPDLPPLPEPPFHEHYLFENPWPAAAALVLIALTAAFALNRAGRGKPALITLLAGVVLTGCVIASGMLIRTDRERVADACRTLVAATSDADGAALRRMLHENVRATSSFASPTGREQVVSIVERQLPTAGIRNARVPEVNAALSGIDMATTQVRVVADTEYGSPGSWWRVDWIRDPNAPADHPTEGWRATHIELLWIFGGR